MMKFASVSREKEQALYEKMQRLGIKEADLIEKFVRSSGRGGQRLHKTSTCVYLKHLPTGIEVKIHQERMQGLNRYLARKILTEKIEERVLGLESAAQKEREKIRRQKRRRSRRAKEKMLKEKKLHSFKKALRAPLKMEAE
jgi:protein subunit release factor B